MVSIKTGAGLVAVMARAKAHDAEYDRLGAVERSLDALAIGSESGDAFDTVINAVWEKRRGLSVRAGRLDKLFDGAPQRARDEWVALPFPARYPAGVAA